MRLPFRLASIMYCCHQFETSSNERTKGEKVNLSICSSNAALVSNCFSSPLNSLVNKTKRASRGAFSPSDLASSFACDNNSPFSPIRDMEKELSTKTPIMGCAASRLLVDNGLKGCAKAKTRKANASARNANNNQCFSLRVLFCSCSIDFKKVKLEKKTVLYLLKWKR